MDQENYALGAGSGAMSCLEGHCGELVINENLITNEFRSLIGKSFVKNKECITKKIQQENMGD